MRERSKKNRFLAAAAVDTLPESSPTIYHGDASNWTLPSHRSCVRAVANRKCASEKMSAKYWTANR